MIFYSENHEYGSAAGGVCLIKPKGFIRQSYWDVFRRETRAIRPPARKRKHGGRQPDVPIGYIPFVLLLLSDFNHRPGEDAEIIQIIFIAPLVAGGVPPILAAPTPIHQPRAISLLATRQAR